ncbi:hypothetical protein BKA93DRAFT_748625 [Sparassis latifolia]
MPTIRSTPPFRAEHIGSLKCPVHLLEKRTDFGPEQIVHMQKIVGIGSVIDGKFRRRVAHCGNADRVKVVGDVNDEHRFLFYDGIFDQLKRMVKPYTFIKSGPSSQTCEGKLKRMKPLYGEAFDRLKNIASADVCIPFFLF